MYATVIGESNIDITVVPQSDANSGGCTPSHIIFHHGGVARNIAHNLCLLGHKVRLMSIFGGDDFSTRLIDDCKRIGMDLSLSTRLKDEKSPVFLSFNDTTGNLKTGFSDIALNGKMDLAWLKGKISEINRSDVVVADTLLSAEALAFLIDHCVVPLYIDTVSPGKAIRFSEAQKTTKRHSVLAIKSNLIEALSLTGKNDATEAAKTLNHNGVNQVYLTLGAQGALHCAESISTHFPSLPATIKNVTGSGDAFFAGIIHAHSKGKNGKLAVPYGLEAAKITLECMEPVNPALKLQLDQQD